MTIVWAEPDRRADWTALHAEMFPDDDDDDATLGYVLDTGGTAFLWLDSAGAAHGCAEVSVRRDYVNGLDHRPAAFLEALYVRPAHRRTGAARALVAAVERWARDQGFAELGSDALLDNAASHAMHTALGFEETERVVCFRRVLSPARSAT